MKKSLKEISLKEVILGCILLIILGGIFLDQEAPTFDINSYITLDLGDEITSNELIEKAIYDVSDNRSSEEEIEVKVDNFTELNTNEKGNYKINFSATDKAGNVSTKTSYIEVKKSKEQALLEKQDDYLKQLNTIEPLLTKVEYDQYEREINDLTIEDYRVYQWQLDEYEREHINTLVEEIKVNQKDAQIKINKLYFTYNIDVESYQNRLDNISFSREEYDTLITVKNDTENLIKELDEEINIQKEAEEAEKVEKEKLEDSQVETNMDDIVNETLISSNETFVEACNTSGYRQPNVKVDIGFDSSYANREYWAYTNEYSQLVYVSADEIIVQNDDIEPVKSNDRYCNDEAKVSGVESSELDEGHVIADSLGGVSNAYNITPQESQLNRYGTQADIEKSIRNAGGATNFEATIAYSDNTTMIPSTYSISYYIGNTPYSYEFSNDYNEETNSVSTTYATEPITENQNIEDQSNPNVYYENCTDVRNHGAAPLYRGDAGWQDKFDRDGDGVACEQ